ncbi:MAG: DUF2442 domain-containing protein [Bacteroidales bacterium]|nr:DUF2442 domain-containing protein [Bacteroidales bacterium]
MDRLKIITAKAKENLCVELVFSDNTCRTINVGQFIRSHPHPQYNKYLDEAEFEKFTIDDGNIVWGEDWDLIFPIEQLYSGAII